MSGAAGRATQQRGGGAFLSDARPCFAILPPHCSALRFGLCSSLSIYIHVFLKTKAFGGAFAGVGASAELAAHGNAWASAAAVGNGLSPAWRDASAAVVRNELRSDLD